MLLAVDVFSVSILGGLWQSQNAKFWRSIPLPLRGRWLCYLLCGTVVLPGALLLLVSFFVFLFITSGLVQQL